MNPFNVLKELKFLVTKRFPLNLTPVLEEEKNIAKKIFKTLLLEMNETDSDFVQLKSIQNLNENNFIDEMSLNSESDDFNESFDNFPADKEYIEKVVNYMRKSDGSLRKYSSVKNRFKSAPCREKLFKWERYIYGCGSKHNVKQINENVFSKFKDARSNNLPVHDNDLKIWALEKSATDNISFKASTHWLYNFKKSYAISSRKVTKTVSASFANENKMLHNIEKTFVEEVKSQISANQMATVINTDQSGFNYEIATKRTHDIRGSKHTWVQAKSVNATTHSYTIQPCLTSNGSLLSKLYIIFQEPKGYFGPFVQKEISKFLPSNMVVKCSKSGKMNKVLLKEFYEKCIKPEINGKFYLLQDSWKGQTDIIPLNAVFGENCQLFTIPPKTTGHIQPLDVYFFRQYKIFARKIYEHINLHKVQTLNMTLRINIIIMHSFIFDQLQAPSFTNMLKYPWQKIGYVEKNISSFKNVNEICFDNVKDKCEVLNCKETAFLKCSHCKLLLCIQHVFGNKSPHLHIATQHNI